MSGQVLCTPRGVAAMDVVSVSSRDSSAANVYVPPFLRRKQATASPHPSSRREPSHRSPLFQDHFKRRPRSPAYQPPTDIKEGTRGHHGSLDAEETVDEIEFLNLKMVGSYSWVEASRPTILVPGRPRVWREERQVGKLKNARELGLMDIADQNAYHCLPHLSPWEPIFHAVDDAQALQQLDIITDRGNLRKLFRLALGDYLPNAEPNKRVWRFDAEVVGSTVILHRWETRSKRTPYPLDKNGFGVAYHLAKTSPAESNEGTEMVTATQGLVRYRFGGLNLLVRFDIDSVLPEDPAAPDPAPTPLSSSGAVKPLSLVVKRYSGPPISHERLLHIATRCFNSDRPEDDSEFTGQLVFSQTPQFGIARHRAGDFSEGDVARYRLDEPPLDRRMAAFDWVLQRVAGLLRQIVEAVRQRGELAFICEQGKLSMYERTDPLVGLSDTAKKILDLQRRSAELPAHLERTSALESPADDGTLSQVDVATSCIDEDSVRLDGLVKSLLEDLEALSLKTEYGPSSTTGT